MRQPPLRSGLRSLAPIAVLLVLAAACTGEPERDRPGDDAGSPTESPAESSPPTGAAGGPGAAGRLVVLDDLGNLVTVDPDGSDPVVIDAAVRGETLVRQPTWSPDGGRLAWVRLRMSDGGTSASLVTAAADGTAPSETPTTVAPFYLSWDPTSSRIAYLGSSASAGIELGIVDVAGGGQAVPLDAGSPLYLSWDPSGEEMVVHVGTDRLERLGIDGTHATVNDRPGVFNAPVWTSDGRSLVYAEETDDGQRLVAHDLDAERGEELVPFEEAITFIVSPDGSRVAFQVASGDDDDGFQVLQSRDDVAPLSVLDRRTGAIERVADGVAPAYFWSPEGDKLLYMVPEVAADRVWFRWGVWDGRSAFTTPRFAPSLEFARDYLQFFEQYAQSMTLWAPDGSAFVYAGSGESGETGVWIQPARPGAEPVLAANGVFAAWSPG